jgi:hypothetical protein
MTQTTTIHQSLLGLIGVSTLTEQAYEELASNRDGFSHARELWVGHGPARFHYVREKFIAAGVTSADVDMSTYMSWLLSHARDEEREGYTLNDALLAAQSIRALDNATIIMVLANPTGGLRVHLNLLAIKAGKKKEKVKKSVDFASEAKIIRAHETKFLGLMAGAVAKGDYDSVIAAEAHVVAMEAHTAAMRRFLVAAQSAALTIPAVPGDAMQDETVSA